MNKNIQKAIRLLEAATGKKVRLVEKISPAAVDDGSIDSVMSRLRELGFQLNDWHGGNDISFEGHDGYEYVIDASEFDFSWDADLVMQHADIYSCCGDRVDKDVMMCPTCHEHL